MKRAHAVAAVYALIAALVVPVFPHFVSPNEFSRWVLAAALVERQTVEVSAEAAMLGPGFEDLAEKDGRLYSNKAPGLAAVSLPGYLAARPFAGAPSPASLRPVLTAMRWFGATLPLLLLALTFTGTARALGLEEPRIASGILILLFATPLFAYGLLLFSHVLVAAALFGAWAALFVAKRERAWLAGALIGVSVASEYTAAIPAAVLIGAVAASRRWKSLARVIAAGAPFAIALGAYHFAAFGAPTTIPNLYDKLPEFRQLAHTGFLGIRPPSPAILARILLDPGKGLLVFSPVLILAIHGLIAARKRVTAPAWWSLLLMPVVILLLQSGYPNWHGGWTTGARYVLPAVPFLVLALLFREGGVAEAILTGWSVCAVTLTAIVFPFVPNAFPLPWSSLALPLLGDGLTAPNLAHLAAPALAVAVPLMLIAAAVIVAVADRTRVAAMAAGFTIALASGAVWPALVHDRRIIDVQRAYIADVYFEQRGALEEFARQHGGPPGLFRRRAFESGLPPASWPF